MQTKSGFMDDRDENGEYRDYENKRRRGQIFVIETQEVHKNSDIDQDRIHFQFQTPELLFFLGPRGPLVEPSMSTRPPVRANFS